MRKSSIRVSLAVLALVFVCSLLPAAVLAQEGSGDEVSADQSERKAALQEKLEELKAERRAAASQRLADNKLRVCEQRADNIEAIMERASARAERQLGVFTTIADRVKAFYVEKGYTLETYDDLVAAVDSAKADAEANLETLQGLEPFDCESEDPKGQVEAFKLALQSINQDLKDYRTAVKNLIVGVKSAGGTTEEEGGEE